MGRRCTCALLTAATAGLVWAGPYRSGSAEEVRGGEREAILLGTQSPWRVHCTWKTELVRSASGQLEPVKVRVGRREWKPAPITRTALPPADWVSPDFDDRSWARFQGSIPSGSRELALTCVRGKFLVKDPGRVEGLTLSLTYRGGVVVYVNGNEIARGHLPDGKIDPETLADDYPKEAYVDPDGMLLRRGFGDPKKYGDRFAQRSRHLKDIEVPAALLREGVNVLAVELRRAPTAEVQIKGRSRTMMSTGASYSQWTMLALESLSLGAPATTSLVPNTSRPARLQVWNQSVAAKVRVVDYGDPCETLQPITIIGCRKGAFSGQVVVSSAEPIKNLNAQAGELKRRNGAGGIGADAVQVRFGVPDGKVYRRPNWFDALEESAPETVSPGATGVAVQPIWITIRVPRDAPPGNYHGTVTLRAEGAGPVQIPVALRVIEWALPHPSDFASHVGLIQSPASVALQYKVPLWSEEHWRLLDKTFALLGEVGADDIFIPLICRTVNGNKHGMVRWVKQPDGGYTHDFSLAEKYIDVALKHQAKIPVVCLYIWDRQGGGWMGWGTRKFEQDKGPPFTVLDPATGELSEAEGPKWGTPESQPFWRPVVEGMRKALAKRGLADSMMFGVAMDQRPPPATFDDLKAIAPQVPWVLHSHSGPTGVLHGVPLGYGAFVHVTKSIPDPSVRRVYGWQTANIFTAFPRYGSGGVGALRSDNLGKFRWQIEGLMVSGHRGLGRVGADFWPVIGRKGRRMSVYCRFGANVSIQLNDSNPAVLAPGRNDPISTVRFEMLREGVQETEARVFIEKVLADEALRARIGGELATRCRDVLDERVRRMLVMTAGLRTMGGWPLNWGLFQALPWQEDSATLYKAAAEVAARLRPDN